MNYVKAEDRAIQDAYRRIANAEMLLLHSYTDDDVAGAMNEMAKARRYQQRAVKAKADWQAQDHDDYEAYPGVPYEVQGQLF